jgi:hypothetical protein
MQPLSCLLQVGVKIQVVQKGMQLLTGVVANSFAGLLIKTPCDTVGKRVVTFTGPLLLSARLLI